LPPRAAGATVSAPVGHGGPSRWVGAWANAEEPPGTAGPSAGVAIYGGTITPAGRNNAAEEAIREQVNSWIRTSGMFDGVVDFDVVLRDPANPHQVLPAYDSGDHLHPNDAGLQAMADAVNIEALRR
jgi:lysophospholipase L1-like esterase